MLKEQLDLVIVAHLKWLKGEPSGVRANLSGADLSGADLSGADLPIFSIVPEEGAFTAFKKVKGDLVLKLEIPSEAKRVSSLIGRKCRAEFVKVLSAFNKDGSECAPGLLMEGLHDGTTYEVGAIVKADSFDDDIRVECTNGIHFFMTRQEAEKYN